MRTLFVPLAMLAMAAPPAFSQQVAVSAAAGTPYSQQSNVAARTLEPAGPLTLRNAVAMALQANPGLSAAFREQEATEAAIV
jgi:cobalt-zinc-cadmium efflux system outer membrane protein